MIFSLFSLVIILSKKSFCRLKGEMGKDGYSSIQSLGSMSYIEIMDSGYGNDTCISSGNISGSSFICVLSYDIDSFLSKSKGCCWV